jgi:hypothetical protein
MVNISPVFGSIATRAAFSALNFSLFSRAYFLTISSASGRELGFLSNNFKISSLMKGEIID